MSLCTFICFLYDREEFLIKDEGNCAKKKIAEEGMGYSEIKKLGGRMEK